MPPAKQQRPRKSTEVLLPPQKPTLFDVLDYKANYPISDNICSLLPVGDIISLTRTCRGLSSLYQSMIPTQWNVDRRLNRFVQDPKGLRSQMGIHNALISGSFVVQFFELVLWKDADLGVFVGGNAGASAMELYLCSKEGYRFIHERTNEEYVSMKDAMKVPNADTTNVLSVMPPLTMSCRSERS